MPTRVLILGAGFGGLELSTMLSEAFGDEVHHPPEEDSDIPGYYALFVFDPDGLRIEVFTPGTEWSSRIHGPRG